MGCTYYKSGDVEVWSCTLGMDAYYAWVSEQQELQWQFEQDTEEDTCLHVTELGMFEARAGVDPFWPVAEVDPYEEIAVEMVPAELL